MLYPEIGHVYTNHTGKNYVVLTIANTRDDSIHHPVVVFECVEDQSVWARTVPYFNGGLGFKRLGPVSLLHPTWVSSIGIKRSLQ